MPNLVSFTNKKYLVLRYLSQWEGSIAMIKDIVPAVHLNRYTVITTIRELRSEGYIERVAKSTYYLTDLGKKVVCSVETEL